MNKVTTGRIGISRNVREKLILAGNVYEKHLADGANSILNDLDGVDWAVTGPKIAECLQLHNEAEAMMKKAENTYRLRDRELIEIEEAIRVSKNILKGKYTKNPKKLGDWGFQVDDTPKQKKKP